MPCSKCFGRIVVFIKLRFHQFHFRTENLERLVDLTEGFLKLLLTLKTNFQTESVSHLTTAFQLDSVRDNVINEHLPLRFGDPVELFMAFPQVQQQTKRHQPNLIHRKMQLADAVIKQSSK